MCRGRGLSQGLPSDSRKESSQAPGREQMVGILSPAPAPALLKAMRNRAARKNHTGRHCLEGGNYPVPERYPNETEEQGQIYCEEWSGPRAAMLYTGSVISYDVDT